MLSITVILGTCPDSARVSSITSPKLDFESVNSSPLEPLWNSVRLKPIADPISRLEWWSSELGSANPNNRIPGTLFPHFGTGASVKENEIAAWEGIFKFKRGFYGDDWMSFIQGENRRRILNLSRLICSIWRMDGFFMMNWRNPHESLGTQWTLVYECTHKEQLGWRQVFPWSVNNSSHGNLLLCPELGWPWSFSSGMTKVHHSWY